MDRTDVKAIGNDFVAGFKSGTHAFFEPVRAVRNLFRKLLTFICR